jgi:SAM-dependent methyltransferase
VSADAFAQRAATWDANPARAAISQAFFHIAAAEAPALCAGEALEFGCGTGSLGLRLAVALGTRMTFVDTSPAMLGVLREKLAAEGIAEGPGGARVLRGELASLPIVPASMDAALALMCLHHVADVPAVIRGLALLLKPGGLLLLGDLLPEDGSFHGAEPVPHKGFDPEALAGACRDAGLAPRTHRCFHTVRKPDAAGTPHDYPLFFLAAAK